MPKRSQSRSCQKTTELISCPKSDALTPTAYPNTYTHAHALPCSPAHAAAAKRVGTCRSSPEPRARKGQAQQNPAQPHPPQLREARRPPGKSPARTQTTLRLQTRCTLQRRHRSCRCVQSGKLQLLVNQHVPPNTDGSVFASRRSPAPSSKALMWQLRASGARR